MKDARRRQLQKSFGELDAAKPLLLSDIPNLPRIRSLEHTQYTAFSSLHTKPHSYVYVHAAHIAGGGDFFVVNGDDVKFYDTDTSSLDLVHVFDDDMRVSPANIAAIDEFFVVIGCSSNRLGGYLLTWDLRTHRIISKITLTKPGTALTGVVRLGKDRLVVGDVRGTMHVVIHEENADNLRLQGVLRNEHRDGIYKLAVPIPISVSVSSPHENTALFAATSVDNTISVWDAVARVRIATIPVGDYVNIDVNERYLACAGSGKLRVYERARTKSIEENKNTKSQHLYRLMTYIIYTVENVSAGWNGGLKLLPNDLVIVGGAGDSTLTVIDLCPCSNAPIPIVIARYSIPFRDLVWLDITADARLILSSGEPQYGIHAVLEITAPKRVVEAFQIYARKRYGKTAEKTAKCKKEKYQGHNHRLFNTIVGTVAKSILFCICIKGVQFALRRFLGGARRCKAGD